MRVLAAIGASLLCVGCSYGDSPEPTSDATVVSRKPAEVTTPIVGASAQQTQVLREILSGVGSRSILRIEVRAAGRDYRPHPPGAVGVRVEHRTGFGPFWESQLVGQAFVDRSQHERLPAVAYVATDDESTLAAPGRTRSDAVPSRRERRELGAAIEKQAASANAELESIRILRPYGAAVAVRFRVARPARFLTEHWERLQGEVAAELMRKRFSAGVMISVEDTAGKNVLAVAGVGQSFGSSQIARKYEGCADVFFSRPIGYEPPPCPVEDR